MKEHEIEALLQKYYSGNTSLQEEKQLKLYLSQHTASPLFRAEKKWFSQLQKEKQVQPKEDFDKKLEEKFDKSKLAAAEKTMLRPLFYWSYRIAALLVVALGLSLIVYFTIKYHQSDWVEISTKEGKTKEFILPDGSKVWLNGSTNMRYSRQFDKVANRQVWLAGEAYFEVSHQPQKPFLVHTSGAVTQVLGTSFNVRGYEGESTVEVGVISGKVAFSAIAHQAQESVLLHPGNGATFSKENNFIQKTEKINPNLLAWKTRQLIFENVPLHEVIATLEKHFGITVKAENSRLLDCHFKGTFKEARLEEILQVMQYSMDISSTKKDRYYLLSGKGCR